MKRTLLFAAMLILMAGSAQAQNQPTQSDDQDKGSLSLFIGAMGGIIPVDDQSMDILANGQRVGTLGDIMSGKATITGDQLPWTVCNRGYSISIYIMSKDSFTPQSMADFFAQGALYGSTLPDSASNEQLEISCTDKDIKKHITTLFSIPLKSKDSMGNPTKTLNTLYDLRYAHAYAIVQIAAPQDNPINLDSIKGKISFSPRNECYTGQALTDEQMDADGDGYEILNLVTDAFMSRLFSADRERLESVKDYILGPVLEMYKSAFGKYPASVAKTKKD